MVATIGRYADAIYFSSDKKLVTAPVRKYWDVAKKSAQESEDEVVEVGEIPKVAGGPFYIRPSGRGKYQYWIFNARFNIFFTHRGELPSYDIQPLAALLYEYDLKAVEYQAQEIIRYTCGNYSGRLTVSRFDLAVDFQHQGFEIPDWRDVITRARKWSMHGDGDPTGFTAGVYTGAFQISIYNKTAELLDSDKSFLPEVWSVTDNYTPGQDVYRAELRMLREGLASFGVSNLSDLLNVLGDIVAYAVAPAEDSSSWFRVCDPDTRNMSEYDQKQRRGRASWWSEVVSFMADGLPYQGVKRKGDNVRWSWDRTIKAAGRQLAKAGAILKMCGYLVPNSPDKIARLVASEFVGQLEELGWPQLVNSIQNEWRGEYFSPTIDYRVDADPLWATRYGMVA